MNATALKVLPNPMKGIFHGNAGKTTNPKLLKITYNLHLNFKCSDVTSIENLTLTLIYYILIHLNTFGSLHKLYCEMFMFADFAIEINVMFYTSRNF